MPPVFNGSQVYRGSDIRQAYWSDSYTSLPASFLLAGVVTVGPSLWVSDCSDTYAARLLGECRRDKAPMIDAMTLAPRGVLVATPGEIVVASVHLNDPDAVHCPTSVQWKCREAIVVDEVVSSSRIYPAPSS